MSKITNYKKLREELHRQQTQVTHRKENQELFKARHRAKHICNECGHIEIRTHFNSFLTSCGNVVLGVLCMFGVFSLYFTLTYESVNDNDKPTLFGYDIITKMETTKLQQMQDMSMDYALRDNGKMGRYIVDTLIAARTERVNKSSYVFHNLTELGVIKALHEAVYDDIIYMPDPPNKDVLYSPLITLTHGGDCDDRAVLFLTLARMSDLECYPVFTTSHAFAYCLYGDEHKRVVFVDPSHKELGLKSTLIGDYLELYVPSYDDDFEVI